MKYEPALDGIRAISIVAVFAYHCSPGSLPGGFTGVDVFFVLSGYLITSVILLDLREETFSMREFYLRRIQRLLPNAVAAVFATLAISFGALLPSETINLARHGIWTLFNLSNVYIYRNFGGYWGDSGTSAPLLHTWSLAVEEQFYLLFPFALVFLARRWSRRIAAGTALIAIASFSLAAYGTWNHPTATFYFLPTRAWEPLLGGVLATFRVRVPRSEPIRGFGPARLRSVAGWAGLAVILAGCFLVSERVPFPGLVALAPTLGAAAVIVSVADGSASVARLLSVPFLALIGRMSYSIYLWHWPGIVLGRAYADLWGHSFRTGTLAGAAAGIVLAAIAYRFVEQPLRRRGTGRSARLFILAAGFAGCVVATVGLSLRAPSTDPESLFETPVFNGLLYDVTRDGASDDLQRKTAFRDVRVPPPQRRSADSWRDGGIIHSWGGGSPRVVVLGSSHAYMFGQVIDDTCRDFGLSVAFLSAQATGAFFKTTAGSVFQSASEAREFDEVRRRWLREWRPDLVLVIDRWDWHAAESFESDLETFVEEMAGLARRVVLFSQVPTLPVGEDINLREYVVWMVRKKGVLPRLAPDGNEQRRRGMVRTMQTVIQGRPGFQLLRVEDPFYAADGTIRYASGREFLYADDDHLSEAGATLVKDRIATTIAGAFGIAKDPPPHTAGSLGADNGS